MYIEMYQGFDSTLYCDITDPDSDTSVISLTEYENYPSIQDSVSQ